MALSRSLCTLSLQDQTAFVKIIKAGLVKTIKDVTNQFYKMGIQSITWLANFIKRPMLSAYWGLIMNPGQCKVILDYKSVKVQNFNVFCSHLFITILHRRKVERNRTSSSRYSDAENLDIKTRPSPLPINTRQEPSYLQVIVIGILRFGIL